MFQIFEPRTEINETCYPMGEFYYYISIHYCLVPFLVPYECPSTGPIEECPTCCCESSDNIEFYDPDSPEPECTASLR